MAFQISSLTIVYSTVHSAANQIIHRGSVSVAFVWGMHRWPVMNSPHEWPGTRKMFPSDDVIMSVKDTTMKTMGTYTVMLILYPQQKTVNNHCPYLMKYTVLNIDALPALPDSTSTIHNVSAWLVYRWRHWRQTTYNNPSTWYALEKWLPYQCTKKKNSRSQFCQDRFQIHFWNNILLVDENLTEICSRWCNWS